MTSWLSLYGVHRMSFNSEISQVDNNVRILFCPEATARKLCCKFPGVFFFKSGNLAWLSLTALIKSKCHVQLPKRAKQWNQCRNKRYYRKRTYPRNNVCVPQFILIQLIPKIPDQETSKNVLIILLLEIPFFFSCPLFL